MTFGTIRPATSCGVTGWLAQPVVDLEAQITAAHGVSMGTIGDASHLWNNGSPRTVANRRHGDHTPWSSDGAPGWVTAIDIGALPGISPTDLRAFALAGAKAGLYPEIKYLVGNNVLNDGRAPWHWKNQYGGDGPDHLHVSFNPGAVRSHSVLVDEAVAWNAARRPDPVTFVRARRRGAVPRPPAKRGRKMTVLIKSNTGDPAVFITDGLRRRWIQDETELAGLQVLLRDNGMDASVHVWDPHHLANIPLDGPTPPPHA